MALAEPTRTCKTCGAEKTLDERNFYRNGPKYWMTNCIPCYLDRCKARRDADPATFNARSKRWYDNNTARHRELMKAWGEAHPGWYDAYNAESRRANPERWRAYGRKSRRKHLAKDAEKSMRRHARKKAAQVGEVDYPTILRRDGRWCHICELPILLSEELEFEHVIPLSRGGAHSMENIRPAHEPCNRWKSDRLMEELDLGAWRALRRSLL